MSLSGGCQCGAVRFRVEDEGLGEASICHCRMCQKAFGSFVGPFLTVANPHLSWTRGSVKHFQSSNFVRRGFCADCGTPLTYERGGDETELAIGAFDEPAAVPPTKQLQVHQAVAYYATLHELPDAPLSGFQGKLVSYQHPDHDTDEWSREA